MVRSPLAEHELISITLQREWMLSTIQALSEAVGPLCAIDLLKPYLMNAGAASANYLRNLSGLRSGDLKDLIILEAMANSWMLGGQIRKLKIEGTGVLEIAECKTNGRCREVCILICKVGCKSVCETINPDATAELRNVLSDGDETCSWIFKNKAADRSVPVIQSLELHLPEVMSDDAVSFGLQTTGELWSIGTTVLTQQLGPRAMELLNKMAEDSAGQWAHRIGREAGITGRELGEAIKVRNYLSDAFHKRGEVRLSENGADAIVRQCPFSGTSQEICHQYHHFLNCVLSDLGVPFGLACDRMMTTGQESCHWTIRRIEEAQKDLPNAKLKAALKALAIKYAEGEIDKVEYDELRKLIGE